MSLTDVVVRLERAYAKQLRGKIATAIDAFLKKTGVGVSHGAIPRLLARAEIEEADGRYAVVDPLFAQWLARG